MRGFKRRTNRARTTPLQQLLKERHIPSVRVEEKLEEKLKGFKYPPPDRRQWSRWRRGWNTPRREQMVWILWAVREVSRDPSIRIDQLFDFNPENPENWPERPTAVDSTGTLLPR